MEFWSWNLKFEFFLKIEDLSLKFGHWECEIENLGMKILNWQFGSWSCSWRFVREIYLVKICSGDFSFEDLFMIFFLSWRCVNEDLVRRFFLWRFIQEISSFKDVFMEICPFKICSWRFILWRFVHGHFSFYEDVFMKIYSRNFSFYEYVFMKICSGDFSFEIFLGDLSFWKFV